MTYNVFGGTLNPAQSNPIYKYCSLIYYTISMRLLHYARTMLWTTGNAESITDIV